MSKSGYRVTATSHGLPIGRDMVLSEVFSTLIFSMLAARSAIKKGYTVRIYRISRDE